MSSITANAPLTFNDVLPTINDIPTTFDNMRFLIALSRYRAKLGAFSRFFRLIDLFERALTLSQMGRKLVITTFSEIYRHGMKKCITFAR